MVKVRDLRAYFWLGDTDLLGVGLLSRGGCLVLRNSRSVDGSVKMKRTFARTLNRDSLCAFSYVDGG